MSSSAVGRYAAYLKKKYLRSKLPIKGKWPPSPCRKIIKLAVIEKKEHTRREIFSRLESVDEYMQENSMSPVTMDKLFEDSSCSKTVVVQGVPGIGKSTFAWKFCRQWAKGKICKQFDLVVLVRIRDIKVKQATDLSDLFFSADVEFSQQISKEVAFCQGKNILFLLEGLDELPVSLLTDDTLLSNLILGELLPEVTILVTTRPWTVQMLKEKCADQIARQVEILGFTEEDILRYASYAFAYSEEEKAEFLHYLHSHPQLGSIMHIPLNAAFVVQIYKQFKSSQQVIPQTLTQLYTALVKGLLLRYLKSVSDFSDLKLSDLDTLPDPIKMHFEQLCLLAFMSFTKVSIQVTFTDSEAALYGCLDSLGLMQSSADLSIDTGTTISHSFLHFTIQEFLAAIHLSKQPTEVQRLFVETHEIDNQFYMLLKFLIGLNSKALLYFKDPTKSQLSTLQLHLLFESQSSLAVCNYLGNGIVKYSSKIATSLDLYALTYCLCHSNCKWELLVNISNFSSMFLSDNYKGKIVKLGLINATFSKLHLIFSLPRQVFSNLSHLEIHSKCDTELAVFKTLTSGLLPSLTEFGFRGIHIKVTSILTAIVASFPNLTSMAISQSLIPPSDMIQLCKYITSSGRLSELDLYLFSNLYESDSLQLLISAVACSKSLRTLSIGGSRFCLADVEMLSVALSTSSTLRILELFNCHIGGEEAEVLASELEENKTLVELYLTYNDINANGAAALGLMLGINTSLKKLYLSKNKMIGTEGSIRLINAMEHNTTLQTLVLPSECEPVEYQSFLFAHIRQQNRISFT